MRWLISWRADPDVLPLADRHYNRQKIGSPQFVPPSSCVVFKTADLRAVWVTSWPIAEYVLHDWAGAWMNSLFRNEGAGLSSELIREAIAATRAVWLREGIPALGMVSFVDALSQPERTLLHKLRRVEAALERYRAEDSDKDRQMRHMEAEHEIAKRRAEEAGYARGVRDMQKETAA